MEYKKLFFAIGGGEELRERISGALMINKYFNSHLEILKSESKPSHMVKFDQHLSDNLLADLNARANERIEEEINRHNKIFEDEAVKYGVTQSTTFIENTATAYVQRRSGYRSELIEQHAKFCDLVIVAAPPEGNLTATFEAAVSRSGKPAIMFPRVMKEFSTKKIIIGWNNSPESSRAVTEAVEIMQAAKEVHIVSTSEYTKDAKDLEDLQAYLLSHGIKTTAEMVKTTRIPGEALLREANAGNFDLIIAGAFSHKGLRELMLGGTTKYILEHTTIPVFMSH